MALAMPLLRRKLRLRAHAEPLYGQFVEERFGCYTKSSTGGWFWIHAVSLGETRTAGILIHALRQLVPEIKFLLTHGTATGREEGAKLLLPGDIQIWQPWDSPKAVDNFFKSFRPQVGLIIETEVWPNWTKLAPHYKVPLVLVNARMSEKSMKQAMRWPSLMFPAFSGFNLVLAQTQDDAIRLRQLTARVDGIFGNIKFDAKPDADQLSLANQWRSELAKPVLIFASSREGEELLWIDAWDRYLKNHPDTAVHWLLVPRHPQRVDEVEQLLQSRGFEVSRRSSWGSQGPAQAVSDPSQPFSASDIFLGDSLGEMALYYGLSDAALLGGSFERFGGQNLIEAAACACPVLMGPHTFNFDEAAKAAEAAGAAFRAEGMFEAISAAINLVSDKKLQGLHAQKAHQFSAEHGGATRRTAFAVLEYLKESGIQQGIDGR
jgi:3-deoxy-D-manno-octulosonic-acid transferase